MFLLQPASGSGDPAAARLVISPSDLRLASLCEFQLVRALDVVLGRAVPVAVQTDAMARRVIELGNAHEQRELRRLAREHPGRVVQFPRPAYDVASLTEAAAQTLATLRSDAEVVYQATFFDGGFVGHADFLERTADGWLVTDTKLARSDSVPALLQIAAYAAALTAAGVATAPTARLVLGSGAVSEHPLADIVPAYRARRSRLDTVLSEHRADDGPAVWGDARWLACGRCEVCEAEIEAARDVLLVAGVRMPTRRRLNEAGVATIEALAACEGPVPDVRDSTLRRIRAQARLQLVQERDPAGAVAFEVHSPEVLRRLPEPSEGDVFFDFEGDPLWSEPGSGVWGLEYLFGLVEVDGVDIDGGERPRFRAFWAHDREAERQALEDFVGYLTARLERWPDLHVYHYAAYETAALLRLAARHGVCEDDIDQFLRDGVFVDLYAVVRASVRVSQRSYSIKKLEPLYMAGRVGAVTRADESIVVYHEVIDARLDGDDATATRLLDEIADYNEDDCVSTLKLRDWLRARVSTEVGDQPHPGPVALSRPAPDVPERRRALLVLEDALRSRIAGVKPHERTAEQQAVAMVAASVQYHAREDKPFWWRHFDRLRSPVDEWVSEAGVFVVTRCDQVGDWHRDTPRRRPRRTLRLGGEPMGGAPLGPGVEVSAVYGDPPPLGVQTQPGHLHARSSSGIKVLAAEEMLAPNGRSHQILTVEELQPKDGDDHGAAPVALVPSGVVRTTKIDGALAELAQLVLDGLPALPEQAAMDLLLRRSPRLRSGGALPTVGSGPDRFVDAITAAVLDLDSSALAVQGPPGTGKTYIGARVVARLVRAGWKVGVCAQSHAAVENVLTAAVAAGVPAGQVGKAAHDTNAPAWTDLGSPDALASFAARQQGGYVIGGTAWDLCHEGRVTRGQLDLLVIDEAGQFSLAKTLAVSLAADRLLLLGDPQQLPQVSQGSHPDPVDDSALGWLIGGEPVLPASHGYFLETTWRMHPALTEPVSRLAYAGRLFSEESVTAARSLAGVEPGLHVREVDHHDNATWSPEEAQVVLDLARGLLGRTWTAPDEESARRPGRPLAQGDICVITPYNAQVGLLRVVLDEAGLVDVPVGTVDRFQGREAPVVIVSMAASAHADVSRGIGFLLDRHRLNVAVSRGKWAAYLVRSVALTDFAPRSPAELIALGAFLGLCEGAASTTTVALPADPVTG